MRSLRNASIMKETGLARQKYLMLEFLPERIISAHAYAGSHDYRGCLAECKEHFRMESLVNHTRLLSMGAQTLSIKPTTCIILYAANLVLYWFNGCKLKLCGWHSTFSRDPHGVTFWTYPCIKNSVLCSTIHQGHEKVSSVTNECRDSPSHIFTDDSSS